MTARSALAERIRALPKVELHLHLEGALSPETLLTLAERNGVRLPWLTAESMAAIYRYRGFDDFKKALLVGVSCLRRAEDFVFAVERLGASLAAENVRYAEVAVTPQFYLRRPEVQADAWLQALNEGRRRVRQQHGIELRWIPDIVRSVPGMSQAVAQWASSDRARENGVVALGLGGPEPGHPAARFAEVFRQARERGLPANPHAGEGTGPQGVRDALLHLEPSRIGHGVGAADDDDLVSELAAMRLPLEICVTSNVRLGLYAAPASHPLKRLVDAGCVITLNTDDPVLFGTSLTEEYVQAVMDCGLSEAQLGQCIVNGARASYLPAPEKSALLACLERTTAALP